MGAPGDELVEVVDADGTVERIATRAEMRACRLRHRCTFVLVRRPGDGAVLAHQRAAWKDVWPSRWDLAFGGVCAPGESWAESAARELAEEAGVDGDLREVGGGAYEDAEVSLVARVFEVAHGGPFTFADGEVVASEWVPLAGLDGWLARHDVVPDTIAVALPSLRR